MSASIALGSHFEEFIRRQLESGRYNNASEVIRAGLRMLEEAELRIDELRIAIQEGIDSGPDVPLEEARERAITRLKARQVARK